MHTNRLAREKSPYLLQHAHNPVDWYPWGPEAFGKACAEDKPIFLSVGYSTCHWCHVMERESFEDPAIAEILNRDFVSIKVDREERPDVDRIYMLFVQATTGGGGWPMSVWLTPELKPFFGGTYFPPDDRYGRPGFADILDRIRKAWHDDQARIRESGDGVVEQLREHSGTTGNRVLLDESVLDTGFQAFRRSYDSKRGGFDTAPKFPRPVTLNFLLRQWRRKRNQEPLDMVLTTLREMAKGGMRDHLGGGFHRYSVDQRWFVPHFEKMLYDQAQLAISYVEAYQVTQDESLGGVAREILEYVLRDMTDAGGGFYSAEDADSVIDAARGGVKGEGAFYVWDKDEIAGVLGGPEGELFCGYYGVEQHGNVADDPHQEFAGKNILYAARPLEAADQAAMETAKAKLVAARARRVRPHLDDKILTAWNGLMISALAKGGKVLGEPGYVAAARRAAEFILARMQASGVLLRRWRDGEAAIPGFLDDYAFFVQALVDLYEITLEPEYLNHAIRLAESFIQRFEDKAAGGFYSTAEGETDLVLRIKDDYDGAEPSGNSVAVLDLLRLASITCRGDFREAADRALSAFAERLVAAPQAIPQMLVAYARSLAQPSNVCEDFRTRSPAIGDVAEFSGLLE